MNTTIEPINIIIQGYSERSFQLKEALSVKSSITYMPEENEAYFKLLKKAHVVITMNWGKSMWNSKTDHSFSDYPNLKLIQLPGAGLDGIDFLKVPLNCKVCNVYEHEIPIAEYCIANMLNYEIKLFDKNIRFKKLDWKDSIVFSGKTHSELYNKKVAILGYGRIGKEVERKLSVFSTKNIAITRKTISIDENISANVLTQNICQILNDVDYLIITCPLNKSTKNLIDKNKLSLMKKSSVIINVGRGPVINETDLYNALLNKTIGGAIIDTWYNYPKNLKENFTLPSKHKFHELDNVFITPHVSAWSENMLYRRYVLIAKNIENLYNGKTLKNMVTIKDQ